MEPLKNWRKTSTEIVRNPNDFFYNYEEHNSFGKSLQFAAVSGFLGGLVVLLAGAIEFAITGYSEHIWGINQDIFIHLGYYAYSLIIILPLLGLILSPIGLIIHSFIVHLVISMFGKKDFEATTEALSFSTITQPTLNWIPLVGLFLGNIYSIFLNYKALRAIQQLNRKQAFIAAISPSIVTGFMGVMLILYWSL